MTNREYLTNMWWSLGVSFSIKNELKNFNPEKAIIDTCKLISFPEDHKIISLMLTWLSVYSRFIHIEALKNRLKTEKLEDSKKRLLKAIALKAIQFGDSRWSIIEKSKTLKTSKHETTIDNETLIELHGTDIEMKKYGLLVSKIKLEEKRKILPIETIVKRNQWLKSRLIYGTNLRSDLISIITLELADYPAKAANIISFHRTSVSRIWKDIMLSIKLGLINNEIRNNIKIV